MRDVRGAAPPYQSEYFPLHSVILCPTSKLTFLATRSGRLCQNGLQHYRHTSHHAGVKPVLGADDLRGVSLPANRACAQFRLRSEERRVGKEGGARGWPYSGKV